MSTLGHIFYLFLTKSPFLILVGLFLVFWLLRLFFKQQEVQPIALKNRLLNLTCGFVTSLVVLIERPITQPLIPGLVSLNFFPDHVWVSTVCSVVLYLLLADFFFYVWHRAEHKVGVLWDVHAVHHSEETLNASSYMRSHWIEALSQGLVIKLPVLLLLDINNKALQCAAIISVTWDFFAHANVRLNMGWLTPVLTGPQLHRLHHAKDKKHHDSNFAQFFPLWDIVFGTYVAPAKNEFPSTGLYSGERMTHLGQMILWPLQHWLQRAKSLRQGHHGE